MTTPPTEVNARVVRTLAEQAGLALPVERAEALAPQLAEWLSAANELSRKMSAPEHAGLMPATVFTQPAAVVQPTQEGGER